MAEIEIKIRDNGPYIVKGGVIVMDPDGNSYEVKDVIALCRCGHSSTKPFCDGSHKTQGFQSAPRAGKEGLRD
ncbi:MAG: CDGSH iron-sulfur domain-containing protein [Chloroflexi bacterium]|nr:CDGSH iron-sulfur domain-containing protein [Chloroflexota bacterium]